MYLELKRKCSCHDLLPERGVNNNNTNKRRRRVALEILAPFTSRNILKGVKGAELKEVRQMWTSVAAHELCNINE